MVDASRTAIRDQCIQKAQDIVANGEGMKEYESADWYRVQLEWQDDCPVILNKISAEGVFVEDYKKWCANWLENITPIAPSQVKFEDMGMDGGVRCAYQTISAGVPLVSTRGMVISYYHGDEHPEEYTFVISSMGNGHLLEQKKAEMGSNVESTLDLNYMHFAPMKDSCDEVCGTEITQVVRTNPNGSLMDALKTKLSAAQSKTLRDVTAAIKAKK